MKKNYGIPYKGSKNKIAEDIINFLPSGDTLVDLFGGGGAITDCASKSGKWKTVIYNELDNLPHDCFIKALKGEFDNETRWISREDFFKLKDIDCYAACCFSFGNDFKTYMCSKEKEVLKKKCHEAIMNNPEYIKARDELRINDMHKKRVEITKDVCRYDEDKQIETIQRLERLQALKRMEKVRLTIQKEVIGIRGKGIHPDCIKELQNINRLEQLQSMKDNSIDNIQFYNEDYRNVSIPEGSIIYCDIPYRNTNTYNKSITFDYDAFYNWCVDKTNEGYSVYISEYNIPDDRFVEVWCKEKTCGFSQTKNTKTIEKIYTVKNML